MDFNIPVIEVSENDTIDVQNMITSIDHERGRKILRTNKSKLWYKQKKIKEGKTINVCDGTKVKN